MKKTHNAKCSFDIESGIAIADIEYKGYHFIGKAYCHEDDSDFKSEKIGCNIANSRAYIKMLKFIRNIELYNQLHEIKYFYNTFPKSFSDSDKINKRFLLEINEIEQTRKYLKDCINTEIDYLKNYIELKDSYHNKIRENRAKANH